MKEFIQLFCKHDYTEWEDFIEERIDDDGEWCCASGEMRYCQKCEKIQERNIYFSPSEDI